MPTGAIVLGANRSFRQVGAGERPIFRLDRGEFAAFYAPGCLCVVGLPAAERFEAAVLQLETAPSPTEVYWANELWHRAELAVAHANGWQDGAFSPECLTLYMNNECNLRCVYCYTDASQGPASRLDLETVVAAAEMVAENCRRKDIPFYVVIHGGGEPTLQLERIDRVMACLEAVAARHEVQLFRYIATNGVLPEGKAHWLARRFDLIGLSCDGPAAIHDSQRAGRDGRGTLHLLERTAHVLQEEGCRLHVRATITRASLHRQTEIADYICQKFLPEEIHFEPVYRCGKVKAAECLSVEHADTFVSHFLKARSVAQGNSVPLLSSGTRPGSLHGPYCNLFRHVINLVPGDGVEGFTSAIATACFKLTSAAQVQETGAAIGALDRGTGRFEIDDRRIQALFPQLSAIMPECRSCFNRYHCAGECPDRCPLDVEVGPPETWMPGFRCRVQKAIASALLTETAARLWAEVLASRTREPHGTAIH
jgi:uncharacterized protein